jgi:hypothetical protein
MSKQEMRVAELVNHIESGYIQKPEMQREYVWQADRVRDLLDSLYRNYPSGTILLWEADELVPVADFSIKTNDNLMRKPLLLLDGQQRLTSLSSVLRGEPIIVRKKGKKTTKEIEILFNLEHPDELVTPSEIEDMPAPHLKDSMNDDDDDDDDDNDNDESKWQRFNQFTFIVSSPQLKNSKNWVNVTEVFKTHNDAPFMEKAGIEKISDPLYIKYSQRLQKLRSIKDYVYRMDVLESTLSYEEVTEIFIRVNSAGVKLKSADLALAQITAKWRNSLRLFQDYQEQVYEEQGFELDVGFFVRGMVIQATDQCKFRTVSSLSTEKLQRGWEQSTRSTSFALNLLKSNIKIDSHVLLTSPFIVHTVAYWAHCKAYEIPDSELKTMIRWILLANTKSRYSMSPETLLDQDLSILRDGGSAIDLIERINLQFGRLDVTEAEISGKTSNGGYFKAMYLAFKEDEAKDWVTNLEISTKHSGAEDKLQFHHIFPKAFLRENYSELSNSQINDVANLAFIGAKTNQQIGSKAPVKYLSKMFPDGNYLALESQAIPTDLAFLGTDNYEAFIQRRRELVVKRINTLLDS